MAELDDRLEPCPDKPNCVSSDAPDRAHRVQPFELTATPEQAWKAARAAVAAMPRTTIIAESGSALRAECRSLLLGFVDDLDLRLRRDEGVIAVRSASRTGYGDLGVNRRRVAQLRAVLRKRGVAR